MTQAPYSPERGDVIWVTLDPALGHGQRGRRPAVVLSDGGYNARTGMLVCCPVTNQAKGYPLEVALPSDARTTGVALADQLKSIDWRERDIALIERLPPRTVAEVLRHAQVMLS